MKVFKKMGICLLSVGAMLAAVACGDGIEFSGEDFISIDEVITNAKAISGSGSGSGSTETTGTPNFIVPEEGYDDSEVTIKFYTTQGSGLKSITDKYIEKFNQIYPNIHVEHSAIGSYDDVRDQIKTELPVNTYPNLAYCYPDHVALYNLTKKVVNLDNLIADENVGLTQAQIDDFIPGYYSEGRSFGDGLMYTLPFSKSTECLYYNIEAFNQLGLQVPTHWFNESAEDTLSVEYACKVLKEAYPNDIPLGYDSEANWMITMAEQCGANYTSASGNHFLFDNTTLKAIAKRFAEWYKNGWVTTQALYGSYTSGLFINDGKDVTDSTGATTHNTRGFMCIGSSAGASHQKPSKVDNVYPFTVGIASIPQMSETNRKVISQGPSVCIFKKSNKQEVVASWLLLKYLTTSVEFQAEFGVASGYVPVLKSVAENTTYKAQLNNAGKGNDYITATAAKVCIDQVNDYYVSPAFNGSSMARDQIGNVLTKILPGVQGKTNEDVNKFINEAFYNAVKECEQSI